MSEHRLEINVRCGRCGKNIRRITGYNEDVKIQCPSCGLVVIQELPD